ncbi:MAG TPA: hypothetical protein PLR03_00155 [Sphaerochaeta sp.]|nr:hypothetical protein [Sphaerochaeta sp.]HPB41219.1 hypothetical protein [Sphaerochaeta sp.]HPY44865.1 hypothetical protein [Sphaerochaeta sp.]HQB04319.1 hypothetical protein [Sphaerochaeta sp.]
MIIPMDSNILGLILSYAFLGVVIAFGIFLKNRFGISSESMRKIVHIGVSNWWFLNLYYFTSLGWAVVGPICFIVVNSLFTLFNWGKHIGLDDRKRNWGLVYFPVTLLLLVIGMHQGVFTPLEATIAVMVMGWGDGLAAMVGSKWGRKKIKTLNKSYPGCLTMGIVSFIVTVLALGTGSSLSAGTILFASFLVGAVAMFVEAFTPWGLDNITVPLAVLLVLRFFL